MADFSFVAQAAEETLGRWGMLDVADSQSIASLVANGVAYWERAFSDGSKFALIRLFSPVVRREEVFLGNVLLNDFLSKALIRAVERNGLGRMRLLANDLQNYYYLYHGEAALDQMAERFRQEILDSLSDLYFGDEDPARGIYGDVGRMLTFYKSNIEPFPAFAVPRDLLPELLGKVSRRLRELVDEEETNINVILAILSFFYARDGAEMQSFYAFLSRAMNEGLLPADAMRGVFALGPGEDFDKDVFTERKKGQVIDRAQLQDAIDGFLSNVQQQIDGGSAETVAANLASKMPALSLGRAASILAQGVQLGFLPLWERGGRADGERRMPCRFCGADAAIVAEKNITCGFGTGRFCNQSPKRRPSEEASALCLRCGVSNYLTIKLSGMHIARPQPKAKDFPVPKQFNIVFHYGHHDEAGARQLAAKIDYLFEQIAYFQQRAREDKKPFSVEYMREELARQEQKASRSPESGSTRELLSNEEAFAALIADDAVAPGLDTLSQMSSDVKTQVLPLGVGDSRLMAFILPQLQPGRDEALDFVQRRFSRSRLAAFTLLALLRKLCGCDGPYYFQSVPTLAPGGFDTNTFYVQGKAENADAAIRHFSAIVNFARRVVKWQDGHSLLADWILMAERLEEDPLGTFSEVLRRTPMRKRDFNKEYRDKFKFRPLAKFESIDETGVIDGTEYLKLIEQLKQL